MGLPFVAVLEAYETLGDEEKRRKYDKDWGVITGTVVQSSPAAVQTPPALLLSRLLELDIKEMEDRLLKLPVEVLDRLLEALAKDIPSFPPANCIGKGVRSARTPARTLKYSS